MFLFRKPRPLTLESLNARVREIEARLGLLPVERAASDPVESALKSLANSAGFEMPQRAKTTEDCRLRPQFKATAASDFDWKGQRLAPNQNISHTGTLVIELRADALVAAIRDNSTALNQLSRKDNNVMATLADIQAKVTAETEVEAGVVTLLTELSAELKNAIANNDPVAMQSIADQLDANSAAMSAAVTANTTPAVPITPAP